MLLPTGLPNEVVRPTPGRELLERFYEQPMPVGVVANFPAPRKWGVYNATPACQGIHLGRLERFSSEYATWTVGYEEVTDPRTGQTHFVISKKIRRRRLQDPAVSHVMIGGEIYIVLTGVAAKADPKAAPGHPGSIFWMRTFIGKTFEHMIELPFGPLMHKGRRIVGTGPDEIGVFTRPMGAIGGRGQIAFLPVHAGSVTDLRRKLTPQAILSAELLPQMVPDDEWVGLNFGEPFSNGLIGMYLHGALFLDRDTTGIAYPPKLYFAGSAVFDPVLNRVFDLKVIATRDSFPEVGYKPNRPDLRPVLYPIAPEHTPELTALGKVKLWVGVGDVKAGYVIIDDPFGDYDVLDLSAIQLSTVALAA